MGNQRVHPGELGGVAVGPAGVAVGEVKVADGDVVGTDLDVARLVLAGLGQGETGKVAGGDGDRQAGQDRDAVIGLLADHGAVVAERPERVGGKGGGLALDFLQQQQVGRVGLQPGCDVGLPLPDRVDVPGGELHARRVRRLQSIEKLVPQPQEEVAFGLRTVKWAPIRASL